jgi:anti-sigma factor RsiW
MTHLSTGLLHAYLDGETTSGQKADAEHHLVSCLRCRREMERLRQLKSVLSQIGAPDPGGNYFSGLSERIMGRIAGQKIVSQTNEFKPAVLASTGQDILRILIRLAAIVTLLFASFYISQVIRQHRAVQWAETISENGVSQDQVVHDNEGMEVSAGINRVGSPPPVETSSPSGGENK